MALCLVLAACGTPITVERVDARTVQSEFTSNAVTTGRLSESTQTVLRRLDLFDVYAQDPSAAIRALGVIVSANASDGDLLFALAEMTFLRGEASNDRSYFLATVVYSYAFLFPASPAHRPNSFDPRLRTAADLYNRALTRGLAAGDGEHVDLHAGDYPLPSGVLSVRFDQDELKWSGYELTRFVPAAELHIEGLQNRYRDAGLGAPLAADLNVIGDPRGFQVARRLKVPTTALLQVDISPVAMATGRFSGTLKLYPGDEDRMVEIGGQQVPLENEPSAAFAYALSNPTIWETEVSGFCAATCSRLCRVNWSRWNPIVPAGYRLCWSMAQRPARGDGPTLSTTFRMIRLSETASSSGCSPTIPAIRYHCRLFSCAPPSRTRPAN
jgi:hypothetical protein